MIKARHRKSSWMLRAKHRMRQARPDRNLKERAQYQGAGIEPVGKNYSKPLRGWKVFWPFERIKPLKIPVAAPRPVGIHSTTCEAQGCFRYRDHATKGAFTIWTTSNGGECYRAASSSQATASV